MRFSALSTQHSALSTFLKWTLALAAAASLVGCGAVGALAYKVTPPPTTPAKYKPVKEVSVIIVENFHNPAASEIDSQQLARLVGDELRANKVVPLVDDNAVNDLRDRDPKAFEKMSIPAIGRAVGAKQVFYVDLQVAAIESSVADQMVKGTFNVAVRVVDVQTGANRWPADAQAGWPVTAESPFVEANDKMNDSVMRRKLQESIALRVGRLFYDWTNEDDAAELK